MLIVRLDAIGDALALTPLVAALRERGCRLGIALRPANAAVFAARAFDRVHVTTFALRDGSRANRAAILRDAREIRREGYAFALIATEDPGGYRLAKAAAIACRVGFENGWGKPLKSLWVRTLCTQTVRRTAGLDPGAPHEAQVAFELGRALLGPDARPVRDARVLRPLVLDHDPPADERILLQVTDKWARLGARLEDVVQTARAVARRRVLRAVAAGSEQAYARAFEDTSGIPVELFAELPAWKAAIAGARAVVAPDSGALHVAGMVGTPVVAVFAGGPAFPLQSARWSPWAAPYRAVALDELWPLVAADALEALLSGTAPIYRG